MRARFSIAEARVVSVGLEFRTRSPKPQIYARTKGVAAKFNYATSPLRSIWIGTLGRLAKP